MKKIVPILLVLNLSIFIISLVISFVILFRPFYYWHIKGLNLEEKTGYSYSEIKEAYDDILDYGVFHKDFSTGVFKHSPDGIDHFKDCQTLFTINFILLFLSTIIVIIKKKHFNDIKLFKHSIGFWSGCLVITLFFIITMCAVIFDFDKIFTLFHNIFFLGKRNWLFNPNSDEIIKILPQRFFINSGILIVSIVTIISIGLIIRDIKHRKVK